MKRAVAVAAALAVLGAASAAAQSLEIGVTRFYRSASRQTIVDGFARVPFTLLDTLTRGANGVAAYRIDIVVRDSANLQLVAQSWSKSVPARLLASDRLWRSERSKDGNHLHLLSCWVPYDAEC